MVLTNLLFAHGNFEFSFTWIFLDISYIKKISLEIQGHDFFGQKKVLFARYGKFQILPWHNQSFHWKFMAMKIIPQCNQSSGQIQKGCKKGFVALTNKN